MASIVLFGVLCFILALSLAANVLQSFAYLALKTQAAATAGDRARVLDFNEVLKKELADNAQKPYIINLGEMQAAKIAGMILREIDKQQAEKEALEDATIH